MFIMRGPLGELIALLALEVRVHAVQTHMGLVLAVRERSGGGVVQGWTGNELQGWTGKGEGL